MNRTKSLVLLATLTVLLLWAGHAIGGETGLFVALLFAAVMNFGAYWFSDRIVLRMHGGQEVTEWEPPLLYGVVRGIAYRAEGNEEFERWKFNCFR